MSKLKLTGLGPGIFIVVHKNIADTALYACAQVYKVGIVFNKVGWYPMGTCAQQVAAESVVFNFGIGHSSDSVRDGLIRSIIFTF